MRSYATGVSVTGLLCVLACSPRPARVAPLTPAAGDTVRPRNEDPQGQKNEAHLRGAIVAEDTTLRPSKDAELVPTRAIPREESPTHVKSEEFTGPPRNEAPLATAKREDFVGPRVSEQARVPAGGIDRERPQQRDTTPETARVLRANLTLDDHELRGRIVLEGALRNVEPGRWVVVGSKQPHTRLGFLISVSDSQFARATSGDSIATVVANRVLYPTGVIEGLALRRGPRVAYLAEEIRDRGGLRESDRFGFSVSQVLSNLGPPAFRSASRSAYDVPVRVTNGGVGTTLQPGQTGTLTVGRVRYAVRIELSRYTVPGAGDESFEEPRHHVKYVIVAVP
jgi:hypothetical protein